MNNKLKAAYAASTALLISAPALAHDPKVLDGGWSALVAHQLTETDHILAFVAAVFLGVGFYALKKTRTKNTLD